MMTAFGQEIAGLRWYSIGMKNSTASDTLCEVQSFLTTFSSMASFFWTTFIALYLFICVWYSTDLLLSRSQCFLLQCIAWGIPVWMLLTGKGWEILTYLITASLYILLKIRTFLKIFINIIDDGSDPKSLFFENFKLALLFLQSYGDSAQAFWNFILFCVFDNTVRSFTVNNCLSFSPNEIASSDIRSYTEERLDTNLQHDNEQEPLLHNRKL
ncbi:uncharacterized protein LOC143053688 [Mytilus galloprovincialis]|uniref:uncharacterized protein LOC143053688 n=1 Tax=Mytilus galloprovincialis TaxID=29158 RepID=UPI003F7C4846